MGVRIRSVDADTERLDKSYLRSADERRRVMQTKKLLKVKLLTHVEELSKHFLAVKADVLVLGIGTKGWLDVMIPNQLYS